MQQDDGAILKLLCSGRASVVSGQSFVVVAVL